MIEKIIQEAYELEGGEPARFEVGIRSNGLNKPWCVVVYKCESRSEYSKRERVFFGEGNSIEEAMRDVLSYIDARRRRRVENLKNEIDRLTRGRS